MQPEPQKSISCSSSACCAADLALELYTLPFYPQLTVRVGETERVRDEKGSGNLEIHCHFTPEESEGQREVGGTLLKATQLIRGRELCLRIPNSGLLEIMGLCFASSLMHALQLETLVTEQGHSITEDN